MGSASVSRLTGPPRQARRAREEVANYILITHALLPGRARSPRSPVSWDQRAFSPRKHRCSAVLAGKMPAIPEGPCFRHELRNQELHCHLPAFVFHHPDET